MKRFLIPIAVIAIVFSSCRNNDRSLVSEVETPVSVEILQPGLIEEYVNTTGTAMPKGASELSSNIAGKYFLQTNPRTSKPWQLGDKIYAGEVIVKLEDQEYLNSIQLETNQLNLELSETELTTQKSLYEKGGVTLKELKTAEINFENSKTTVSNSKLKLEKMSITAPFDGILTDLSYYTQGTQIAAGTAIAKVMDYRTMYMEIQLPEKYISIVTPGQKVKLTNYTLPTDTITGEVTQLSPAIDASSRTFKGMIAIDNPQLLLRPGMFVKADVVTKQQQNVIVIPKSIILSRQKGKTVFVIERGIAIERIIETGLENVTDIEVTSGLAVDERIVVSGYETLSDRTKVKIIN